MTATDSHYDRYDYVFKTEDGRELAHTVWVDAATYLSHVDSDAPPPAWTEMAFQQCKGCNCSASHCPVAVRLVKPLQIYGAMESFAPVEVTVHSPNRVYYKKTDMQDGLRSLFGLLMATSGCPSMDVFRVLARHHMPFASFEENFFRVVGVYMLSNYFITQNQPAPALDLQGVRDIYERVAQVNHGIVTRIKQASEQDSALNAVVMWDSMSSLMSFNLEASLKELEAQFIHTP